MTATRSITWRIPSTSSRTASRIIIPATFTARRNPGTVSQSLLRLRDFRGWNGNGLRDARGATCGVVSPDFHALTSAKIATGEKKIAFPRRLPANAPSDTSWVHESVCANANCVYVCVRVCSASTLFSWNYVFSLGNVKLTRRIVNWRQRRDGMISQLCTRVLYTGVKLSKVSKLYRCIFWPSWSQFFPRESMETLFSASTIWLFWVIYVHNWKWKILEISQKFK